MSEEDDGIPFAPSDDAGMVAVPNENDEVDESAKEEEKEEEEVDNRATGRIWFFALQCSSLLSLALAISVIFDCSFVMPTDSYHQYGWFRGRHIGLFYRGISNDEDADDYGKCIAWSKDEREGFFDSSMRWARSSSVLSVVLSGLATILIHSLLVLNVQTFERGPRLWKYAAVRLLFAALVFQILTFLAFSSWFCSDQGYDAEVCEIDTGSGLSIACSITLFLATLILCRMPPEATTPAVENKQARRITIVSLVVLLLAGMLIILTLSLTLRKRGETWMWSSNLQLGQVLVGDNKCDTFGASTSLSADGRTLAVGASTTAGLHRERMSYAKVYRFSSEQNEWKQVGSTIFRAGAFRNFVSLSAGGSHLAVATTETEGPGMRYIQVGVYRVSEDDEWTLVGNRFVWGLNSAGSLSADATTLAVAFPRTVSVYRVVVDNQNEESWVQVGVDIAVDESEKFGFGKSISLSENGEIVAVGTTETTFRDTIDSVKVFTWNGEQWTKLGSDIRLDNSMSAASLTLSASGTIAALRGERGVNVFEFVDQEWVRIAFLERPWANSIALSANGKVLVVGESASSGGFYANGQLSVFHQTKDGWIQVGQSTPGKGHYDEFGHSVSVSADGEIVAIGAPQFLHHNNCSPDRTRSRRLFKFFESPYPPGYTVVFQRCNNGK